MEGRRTGAWRTETGTKWRGGVLDRLRRRGISKLLVLLLVLPVAAEPQEPGYADAKIASPARTGRAGVRLAFPADQLPRRGMLVATGNVLSPLARWIVIDLDLMTIRQATTRLADAGGLVEIESERTDAISDDERRNVIASGNEVWITPPPDTPVLGEPTDRLCSVALFDGDDVLQEVGSDCPRPRLVGVLEALAASANGRARSQGHAPEPPSAKASIGSAHREPDGTLVLWLRAESEAGSVVGHGEVRYPPSNQHYDRVLRHLGPIPPGGEVLVWPFPPHWPDEPALPQRPRS
ncbi:hypothetical protein G8E10_18555 [Rhizobiaceae bacterium CRRU44]|uniref:Uncharacterized protein n=1 Tax=Ferranicluibacter rubi TaxID=2715133 RepID=A0AA43ZGZ2_9HYPH|nr:hypothetical protein [Ferranicluibacter rubi]NHT77709.1 hypothetical protein [Ferranicluibacter rubi]